MINTREKENGNMLKMKYNKTEEEKEVEKISEYALDEFVKNESLEKLIEETGKNRNEIKK